MKVVKISAEETIAIRHQVLWPKKEASFCIVDGDQEALHFAVSLNDKLISVASIYIDNGKARLRKFATLPTHQGQGVGTFLLNWIVDYLMTVETNYLWFDARDSAIDFYKRLGFKICSDRFFKSEVGYFKMEKHLRAITPLK